MGLSSKNEDFTGPPSPDSVATLLGRPDSVASDRSTCLQSPVPDTVGTSTNSTHELLDFSEEQIKEQTELLRYKNEVSKREKFYKDVSTQEGYKSLEQYYQAITDLDDRKY